jgi:hypothetical protein
VVEGDQHNDRRQAMGIPKFSYNDIAAKARSIGTNFVLKSPSDTYANPKKPGLPLTDEEGREIETDKSRDAYGNKPILYMHLERQWHAWINRETVEFMRFDAPPPYVIHAMLVAEWESAQIGAGVGAGVEKPASSRL